MRSHTRRGGRGLSSAVLIALAALTSAGAAVDAEDAGRDRLREREDCASSGRNQGEEDACARSLGCPLPPTAEVCDGEDNDCDGSIDEGFDPDGDGLTSCARARSLEFLDLYVGSTGSGQILRYDGLIGTPLPSAGNGGAVFVPSSPGVRGVVFGPKEDLWAVNSLANSVERYSVLDGSDLPSAGNPGATFVAPGSGGLAQPRDLVFGPDRNGDGESDLYVTDDGFIPDIYVYDGRTGQFLLRLTNDPAIHPRGVTIGSNGDFYVTGDHQIRRYDGASGVFLGVFAVDPSGGDSQLDLEFGPDGHLYATNGAANTVRRFNGTTGTDMGDFVTSGSGGLLAPAGLAWGPNVTGDRVPDLFVVSAGTNSVKAYSGLTGAYLGDFADGGGLTEPAFIAFRPGEWRTQLNNPSANYHNVADAAFNYFRKYRPDDEEEDDERLFFLRYDYFMRSRADVENGEGTLATANIAMQQFLHGGVGGPPSICPGPTTPPSSWTLLGPSSVPPPNNPSGATGTGLGRIRSIALDTSTNPWQLYAGSELGGLWRTPFTTAPTWTPTWTNLTDASGIPATIAVTEIVLDSSTTPSTIYIATGYAYGVGVMKSTDGGLTWTNPIAYSPSQLVVCGPMVLDPNPIPNTTTHALYVACSKPAPTSSDPPIPTLIRLVGATATKLLQWPPPNYQWWWQNPGFADLDVDANTGSTVLYVAGADASCCSAGADQMWRIDNPAGATPVVTSLPSNPTTPVLNLDPLRIELAVSKAAPPGTVWRVLFDGIGGGIYLQKSTNFGATWTKPGGGPSGSYQTLSLAGVDSWTGRLAVSPANPGWMYIAGILPFRSLDGGLTFTQIGTNVWNAPNRVHDDTRAWLAVVNGSQELVFTGNDGGIFLTTNQGTTWRDISNGLPIVMYYGLGGTESIPGRVLAGAQDKTADLLDGGVWKATPTFGDGADAVIDYADPFARVLYTEANGLLIKSHDAGLTWPQGSFFSGGWRLGTPMAIDPADNKTLYVGSLTKMWKTTDGGLTYSNITAAAGPLDGNGSQYLTPEAIAVASSNHNILYFGRGGHTGNGPPQKRLFRSSDGGATWIDRTLSFPGVAYAWIQDIVVDPKNADRIWVSLSHFSNWKVGYSPDGGITWVNVSAGLPNFPVVALAYQKCTDDVIYAATDVGVYRWDKAAMTWKCWSYGLPITNVTDLEIIYTSGKIRASTYGRSLWESPLSPPTQWPCGPCNLATPSISGPTDVCTLSAVYTSDGKPGIRYTWQVVSGGPATYSAGSSVPVTWGSSGGIVTVSAMDLATGCTSAPVSLTASPCINGEVSGQKLEDPNHDGIPDGPPLGGWTIQAMSGAGATAANPSVTNGSGLYALSNLQIGTHTISEIGQPGWVQTYPASGTHSVSFWFSTTLSPMDFGNYQCPAPAPPSGCVTPPLDMIAWWPMDFFVDGGLACSPSDGLAFTTDIVRGKEDRVFGSPQGSTAGNGCVPTPASLVGGGIVFDGIDDYVEAPDQASLNFGPGTSGTDNGNFSIEAWIWRPSLDADVQIIVDKRREESGPSTVGYAFFLLNNAVWLQLADGVGTQISNYNSALSVPAGWHHVGVTVDRDQSSGILFYVDGNPSAPGNPTGRSGSLVNTKPLRIGRRSDSSSPAFFSGLIDELEIFKRVLLPSEIQALYSAGNALQGKCKKPRCHLPASTGLAHNDKSSVVTVTICNNSGTPGAFRWSLAPSIATGGAPCQLNGPTTFQPPAGTITVPAGECVGIPVTVSRPAGFVAAGLTACYEVTAVPDGGNECFSCRGSLLDSRPWEITGSSPAGTVLRVAAGQTTSAAFGVENTGSEPRALTYAFDVVSPGPDGVNTNVSLNGHPPGTSVQGAIALPGGASAIVSVEASFLQHEPFAIYDLVVKGDTDDDSVPDTNLGSIGMRSVLESSAVTPCDDSPPSDAITQVWTSRERLTWNRLRDCDGLFNVYRQTGERLMDAGGDGLADSYGTCFQQGLTTPEAFDESRPSAGSVHFYLVTGSNAFGEGSLGTNSSGLPRPNSDHCP